MLTALPALQLQEKMGKWLSQYAPVLFRTISSYVFMNFHMKPALEVSWHFYTWAFCWSNYISLCMDCSQAACSCILLQVRCPMTTVSELIEQYNIR